MIANCSARVGPANVASLVQQNPKGQMLGLLGEPRVNILTLNLALDAKYGKL